MFTNPYEITKWDRNHFGSYGIGGILEQFVKDNPVVGAFDTETTGLHLKKDKPFLVAFGWLIPGRDYGRVYTFHPTPENMEYLIYMLERLRFAVGHNIKFDLHMSANVGFPYMKNNLCDTMSMARLALDVLELTANGKWSHPEIGLKRLGELYVHPDAGNGDRALRALKAELNRKNAAMKKHYLREAGYRVKDLEEFLKDCLNDIEDMPEGMREAYLKWKQEYGEVNYQDMYQYNPDLMIRYAQDDVITTLELFRKFTPTIKARKQSETLKRECDIIIPVWKMERAGLRVDRDYLFERKQVMKDYIRKKRDKLCELAGVPITCNQHAKIKELLHMWNYPVEKTGEHYLKKLKLNTTGRVREFAETILELRTLEKWYSTYLLRMIEESEYDGRLYTQLNPAGAVSGRFTSDAQQFPKTPIYDDQGNELFHPRRAIIPTDRGKSEGYTSIWYIDFSQVELRLQAHYTIKVAKALYKDPNRGDVNLCRAYMPYLCKHYRTGEIFDFQSPEGRKRWNELKEGHPDPNTVEGGLETVLKEGWSAWVIPETGEPWKPTDMHSETTHSALTILGYKCNKKYEHYVATPEMTEEQKLGGDIIDKAKFKQLRNAFGKPFNFMKTYGGGIRAAMEQLDLPQVAAEALLKGYDQAFPEVSTYQKLIVHLHQLRGYIQNEYGRRYYLDSTCDKGYKLGNYTIQGLGAEMIKECIYRINNLLEELNLKTRLILPVHDELQAECWSGEEWVMKKIKTLMEDFGWSFIPIIAEVDRTYTCWAEKEGVAL